jgi:GT2 family glycosyltransferase
MDVDGNKLKDLPMDFAENQVFSGTQVVTTISKHHGLYGCCMLIPKSAFDELGGFAEDLRFSQDFLMWYRIFLAGYSMVTDHRLNVMCRLHRNQVTNLRRDLYEHDAVIIAKLLAEPLADVDADGTLLMLYLKRLTKYQCKEAIAYVRDYAAEKGFMTPKRRLAYYLYQCKGFFRYRLATFAKKYLYKR